MEQVVNERPFFEDPHIKQQQTSTVGTLGVFGAELQDLSHGWYPKRQTGLNRTPKKQKSSGPQDYSFVKKAKRKCTNNRAEGNVLHQKGETPVMDQHKSEAEIGKGDVMKQVKQDREGLVKTCEISTAGKKAITAEVVSDSIVSCEKNHPVVSVLNKDGDAGIKIVSTPGGNEKTEAVKTNSGKRKRRRSKRPADVDKKDTTDPATQSASKSPGGSLDSGKRKRRRSKRPADAGKKETTYPATQSEAEIVQRDVTKQVKQDDKGLVIETCEISTSAGKNVINAEVIVSDSTVSCEKNHASPVVGVLNKDSDAVMKIVSTLGKSEKTEAVKTNSRKKKRRSKCPSDAMKKETTDPETQSASITPGGCPDSSICILNQRSEAEIGQGDVIKQAKQDVKGLVMETCEISTSAGKNATNAEVIVSDSTVSCEKNNTSPVVSLLKKDGDTEMKIVSTPEGCEKTEAVKTNSRKKKKRRSKCPADAMKKETTDPATQSALITPGGCLDSSISILNQRSEAEVIVSDSTVSCEKNHTSPAVSVLNKGGDAEMKIVSIPGGSEKTEAAKTISRKKKRRRSECPADAMKKETTDPETQSTSITPGGGMDLSISILNQRSEAEIGQGDVMKQVKQDVEGLVIETGKISTSAGKNAINAEVIVPNLSVSCEKNHTSPFGSVLNKDCDAEMIVSTPGGSEKTEAVKTNSRKKKRRGSKCPADAIMKETTDLATQIASKTPGGCLDTSISILNQRSEAEIGRGDVVMKQVKQGAEGLVIEPCEISTSAGKNAINAEVIVSDSTVSCEKNHTSPIESVLNKDGDAEKIVSTPGGSEKTEAVKTNSRKKKRRRSKCPADAMKKETTDPATQSASITPGGCLDSSISILNQGSEAEVIVSDSTVSCEKNHTSPVVSVLNKEGDAEMKIVSTPGESEKIEAVETNSRKKKKRCSKRHADVVKKETTDPATQSASITPSGRLDSTISIVNQRSEAEIRQGDVMKQVKKDGEGLVIETFEISTSAGKNAINAEVIVSNSTVSCKKNHTSPVEGDAEMKIVSTPGESDKTEAVETNSRKKKKRCSKRHADPVKKETTDPATQSASITPSGFLDSSISILNQRSEAEIGQRDVMKQVKQGAEGLVIEPCEISTSAGKNSINAEVIVSDSTVSCEKNNTSPVVSVMNKNGDAEMKIVSTLGESEKTEAEKTNSRKKKRRRSECPADAMKKETTDPATQSASITPGDCLDSSISVLNQRSEAEIGKEDVVMKQVKQDGEGLVMETCEISSSTGKNAIYAGEVIVSDSTVSCEKNHTSPVLSVLNKDGDAEMKIVSTPGESEKTEAVKTVSKKRKKRCSKHPADDAMKKESTDPATQSTSKSLGGSLDPSISILNKSSEAESEEGNVMKQDGEGLMIETCEISTSSGKNAVNSEVTVSDSTVSCEKNHASLAVSASKSLGVTSPRHPHDFSVTGASADLSTIDHPNQQREQKNEELISEIQNNNQPTLPVLQDEPVHIDDSGCCTMQTSDSLSRAVTSVSKRKLLVIDMNGILVDVTWTSSCGPKPDIMVSKKGVFKRPFCDDFLKFCFERFDVGVWSSRVRVNLDKIVDFVMGDAKKRLLFCWDQSHCTQTGYNTRENRQKPLVLKELRKLWEKQVRGLPWESGYYNETNTILLDDSPYKALRNPPNTAIFLHPYSYKMIGDQALGPDGDLRKYLIRLSEAENVQKFIEENPLGQDPITESSQCWGFYQHIAEPTDRALHGKKG